LLGFCTVRADDETRVYLADKPENEPKYINASFIDVSVCSNLSEYGSVFIMAAQ